MKPKWHKNLTLICEKCGNKLVKSGEKNPSIELKDWVKKKLIDQSLWGVNRVVTSSCLDVCPESKIVVAYVSDRKDLESHVEVIDPKTERERILQITLERAK